jgi:nucleotide-binding universal stress UspA family protein
MRVLVATDGSTCARHAVRTVGASFSPDSTSFVVMTATGNEEPAPTGHFEAVQHLRSAGFAVESVVVTGGAARSIRSVASDHGCDLIALGHRGRHGVSRLLAGSVALAVVHQARIPILVAMEERPLRRIVVGFDGSPDSRACLEAIVRLPLLREPDLVVATVFHVGHALQSGIAPTMWDAAQAAYEDELQLAETAARATAAEGCHQLSQHGANARPLICEGYAPGSLAGIAVDVDADAIAVGSRGRSALSGMILGSTSTALVNAGSRNLLIVRGPGEIPV